jgi:hypothetical protein
LSAKAGEQERKSPKTLSLAECCSLEGEYEFGTVHYLDILGVRSAVRGFGYRVELSQGTHEFTIGNSASVAELVFRSVEGTVEQPIDRVVYDTDLEGFTLDEEGRVITRPPQAVVTERPTFQAS